MEKNIILDTTNTENNKLNKQRHDKLKNKDAAEFKLVNDGEFIDMIPVERENEREEIIKKRENFMNDLMATNEENIPSNENNKETRNKFFDSLSENLKKFFLLVKELRTKNPEILNIYFNEKNDVYGFFEKELHMKIENFEEKEVNFLYDNFFNISKSKDIKMKEYNEYGLPKDMDPSLLEFVSNTEFNPDTDEFVAPVFDNLDCNRIHFDLQREELPEDYREVFDQLNDEENIVEEVDGKEALKNQYKDENKNKKISKNNDFNFLDDNFVLIANGGTLPIYMNDEIIDKEYESDNDNVIDFDEIEKNQENEKKDLADIKNIKNNDPTNLYNNAIYKPSYKHISPDEVNLLNSNYKKTILEYEEKGDVKVEKKTWETKKQEKSKLKDAMLEIDELIPKSKFPNKKTQDIENNKLDEKIENEEEEEYDEEEEFEDYELPDDEERFDGFDDSEKKDLVIQDGVDLLSKNDLDKILAKYEKKQGKQNKGMEVIEDDEDDVDYEDLEEEDDDENKSDDYDGQKGEKYVKKDTTKKTTKKMKRGGLTWEEMNKINLDTTIHEKTIQLLEKYAKDEQMREEEEMNKKNENLNKNPKKRITKYNKTLSKDDNNTEAEPQYYMIHNPRVYQNIIDTMEEDIHNVNMPKKIGVKSEKIRKNNNNTTMFGNNDITNLNQTNNNNITNLNEKTSKTVIVIKNKKEMNFTNENSNKKTKHEIEDENIELDVDALKKENKERKKMVKQENKENREKKKVLKTAFKTEKIRVNNVITSANKVIRNGLSVKEI